VKDLREAEVFRREQVRVHFQALSTVERPVAPGVRDCQFNNIRSNPAGWAAAAKECRAQVRAQFSTGTQCGLSPSTPSKGGPCVSEDRPTRCSTGIPTQR
jgi:hypothetical protein